MDNDSDSLSDSSDYSTSESDIEENDLTYFELLLKFLWSIFGF